MFILNRMPNKNTVLSKRTCVSELMSLTPHVFWARVNVPQPSVSRSEVRTDRSGYGLMDRLCGHRFNPRVGQNLIYTDKGGQNAAKEQFVFEFATQKNDDNRFLRCIVMISLKQPIVNLLD